MINIPKSVKDPFYRYKREIVNIESQKIGYKIKNIDVIAESLNLKPGTLMKFWQKKLGCQSKKDIIFHKSLNYNTLDDLLEGLIGLLICPACKNPEMKINKVKKDIFIKCLACGNERKCEEGLKKLLISEC